MSPQLPQYPTGIGNPSSWKDLDLIDQYSRFDRLVMNAEKNALFDALPESREATKTNSFYKRGEAMAERLWLLGYLSAGSKHEARDQFQRRRKLFLQAVKAFQTDAGLKADKWTGIKTWQALGTLVSFENDEFCEEWQTSPEKFPAVLRAVQCRLSILGLINDLPRKEFKRVKFSGLKKFRRLMLALGGVKIEGNQVEVDSFLNNPKPDTGTLSLLMDQDSLISIISRSCLPGKDGLAFSYSPDEKTGHPQPYEIRRFLTRLVQVELWLLGYDIKITGQLTYPVKGVDTGNKTGCSRKLRTCLEDLARLCGEKKGIWKHRITPELFQIFARMEAQKDEVSVHERIEKELNTQQAVEHALEKGRKFHLRLWDGIKRVFRWIGRLFKKARDSILDLGRTVARIFFTAVQDVFNTVKNAIRIAAASMAALDGTMEISGKNLLSISCDGDIVVVLSDPPENGLRIVRKLKLNAQRFCLAAKICAMVLSGLIQATLSRWAALAKVLYQNFKECILLFKEIQDLEDESALPSPE